MNRADEARFIFGVAKDAGDVRQENEFLGTDGFGDFEGGDVGVNIVGLAVGSDADGGNDGDEAVSCEGVDDLGVDFFDLAHVAELLFGFLHFGGEEVRGFAGNAHRTDAAFVEAGDNVAADFAREHHFRCTQGFQIGNALTVDKRGLSPKTIEQLGDFLAAAMDDDEVDADHVHKGDVFENVFLEPFIHHGGAAVFDDRQLATVALQVGKRFDQVFGFFEEFIQMGGVDGCAHAGAFFSLEGTYLR